MGNEANKNKDQGKEELEIAIAIQNEVCWKTERTFHLSLGRVAGCGWVCLCLCVSVRAKARYPRSSLPAFIGSSIKLLCVCVCVCVCVVCVRCLCVMVALLLRNCVCA